VAPHPCLEGLMQIGEATCTRTVPKCTRAAQVRNSLLAASQDKEALVGRQAPSGRR